MSYDDLPLFAEPSPRPPATILCDDVLAWAEKTPPIGAMAMLCDPPYELNFMGRNWDRSGIAFKPDTWKALAQHLLPGAFLMAFGGARTYHRLACALEDAGLIIHPALGWLNGAGFPKATRIDTQIDAHGGANIDWFGPWLRQWREERGIPQKELARHFPSKTGGLTGCVANWELGLNMPTVEQYNTLIQVLNLPFETLEEAEREVIGQRTTGIGTGNGSVPIMSDGNRAVTAPSTPLAQAWAGHRYGMQAMKPAIEFIALAQVPYSKKPVQSITQTGAGALWIEGARISTGPRDTIFAKNPHTRNQAGGWPIGKRHNDLTPYDPSQGRWPPNFAMSHLPGCVRVGARQVQTQWGQATQRTTSPHSQVCYHERRKTDKPIGYTDATGHETVAEYRCAPGCVVAKLDAQAGERKSGGRTTHAGDEMHGNWRIHEGRTDARRAASDYEQASSTGHASRFFFTADWSLDVAERLAQADPIFYSAKASRRERDAGLEGVPLKASGIMQDDAYRWEHDGKGNKINLNTKRHNPHPCVKPLKLCQWLATLLLPPDAYAPRRLLVPFAGVASEMVGAMLAGWEEIVGIESDPSYVEIARQRVAYWQQHPKT